MTNKLISFDLKAEMGFLKKPDINDGIYLTYNMLHKPALLGILGAIIGLEGYKKNEDLPIYYKLLNKIKIGIEPLNSDKGNFQKTTIKYNNSTGFASDEAGGNLPVNEQTIIKPSFRCYLHLNTNNVYEQQLYDRIKNQQAEYLPYMGKNDFSAWWDKDSVKEYVYDDRKPENSFKIKTLFYKNSTSVNQERESTFSGFDLFGGSLTGEDFFLFFERLPIGFNEQLYQYNMADFAYTTVKFKKETNLTDLYYLIDEDQYIQLY